MRTAFALVLPLALSLPAGPAWAAEAEPAKPSPWIAAAASGLAFPLAASVIGAGLGSLGSTPAAMPLNVLWAATPLLIGSGQFYAGDRKRGVLVGLGGPVVVASGAALGWALIPKSPADSQAGLGGILLGGGLAAIAYPIWATVDAYQTAERLNQAKDKAQAAP